MPVSAVPGSTEALSRSLPTGSSPGRSGDESNSSDPTLHGQPLPSPHRDLQELRGLQGAGLLGSEQFSRPHRQLQQQPPLPPGGLPVSSRKALRDNVVRCVPPQPPPPPQPPAPTPAPAEVRAGAGLPGLALDDPHLLETSV